jgi:hypothetical protein
MAVGKKAKKKAAKKVKQQANTTVYTPLDRRRFSKVSQMLFYTNEVLQPCEMPRKEKPYKATLAYGRASHLGTLHSNIYVKSVELWTIQQP